MCPVSLSTLLPQFVVLPLFRIHLCLVSYSPPVYSSQCFPLGLWWLGWLFCPLCFLVLPSHSVYLHLLPDSFCHFWFASRFAFCSWINPVFVVCLLLLGFWIWISGLSACLKLAIVFYLPASVSAFGSPFVTFLFKRTQRCMSGQFSLMVETVWGVSVRANEQLLPYSNSETS